MAVRESRFQRHVVDALKQMFPGCVVIKNDPQNRQGLPDLLVLFGSRWAMLEVKSSLNSRRRPNQAYYVQMLGQMSFAAFISPENEEEVLNDLQYAFTH
jgi:hypothetical protein